MRQTETRQCDDVVQCPACGAPYDRERGYTGIRLCPRCKGPVDADPMANAMAAEAARQLAGDSPARLTFRGGVRDDRGGLCAVCGTLQMYERRKVVAGVCESCGGPIDAPLVGSDGSEAPIVEEGPLEGPFYSLCAAVCRAVADYDQTRDHSRHGPDSDCVRCALVEALPPGARGRLEPRWSRVVAEVY